MGDLGPRIRGLDRHATVLGLGQISAERCYAVCKVSPAVFKKQIRNDVGREHEEGAVDNATMGTWRGRNSMKSDNVLAREAAFWW